MRALSRCFAICALGVMASAPAAANQAGAAETVHVTSIQAKILAERRLAAEVLGTVARGDSLTAVRRDGRWVAVVIADGREGWIHELLVSAEPPAPRATIINIDTELGQRARRRASEITSAAAPRGLSPADHEAWVQAHTSDFASLAWLVAEAAKVTRSEAVDHTLGDSR